MNSCDQLYIQVAVHLRMWIDRLRPDIECSYLGAAATIMPVALAEPWVSRAVLRAERLLTCADWVRV